jgi:hypothetical protein
MTQVKCLICKKVLQAATGSSDFLQKHIDEMVHVTTELIKERSFTVVRGNTLSVDVVRDILNVMPLHWVAKLVSLEFSFLHHSLIYISSAS